MFNLARLMDSRECRLLVSDRIPINLWQQDSVFTYEPYHMTTQSRFELIRSTITSQSYACIGREYLL